MEAEEQENIFSYLSDGSYIKGKDIYLFTNISIMFLSPVKIFKKRMLNSIIISLQSVNEWPVFNLKIQIDKHSKITAGKDSLQYLIRLLSSKQLLCFLNIWNFYYVIFIPVINL